MIKLSIIDTLAYYWAFWAHAQKRKALWECKNFLANETYFQATFFRKENLELSLVIVCFI